MEYIQTVLVQVEATKIDEASRPQGLLAELDEHRSFLQHQPGFQDMRVTRSINEQGNVLLVVETRWQDDDSLVEYETREPNVMSIIGKHQDLIVADTLQVLDMEALRTETERGPAHAAEEVSERLALPLLLPVVVLAFVLLVTYGLSRIYLEVSTEVATPLAAGIATAILGVSWYLASHPSAPRWQIGSIAVVVAAFLLGGTIFAAVHEDGAEAEPGVSEEPGASPGPGAPGGLAVEMGDNFFVFEGEQEPAIAITAGEEVTINLTNDGAAIHNMHIDGTSDEYASIICETGGDEPCSDPSRMAGGETGTMTFQLDQPGTYNFRCDFHPQEMTGTLEVQ
ncbi:MAG: cupredoxin domain-containing protein [Dehalococcoidia bacterium]